MFALRRWGGGWVVDLTAIGAGGPAAAPELPAAALPAIGAVLGALFELDNTDDPKSPVKTGDERVRVGAPSRRRVESAARPRDGEVRDEADEPAKNPAKRSTR
jgi:hypothetical protein